MKSIQIRDHLTENATLPVIAQPVAELLGKKSDVPFFSLQFDKSPLHSDDDLFLKVRMQGSDLVVNIDWIRGLVDLFKSPFKKKSNVQVEQKIGKKLSSIKNNSVTQIQSLLRHHKHIGLDIEACAPRIMIPEDSEPDAPILIVDLGYLKISTKKKQKPKSLTFDKNGRWQEHLYDQFRLDATSLQLLLISASSWPLIPQENYSPSIQLLEKFDVSLSLDVLMCSPSEKLAKIRLSGYTPGIKFKLTGSQVRDLIRIGLAVSQDPGPGDPLPELVPVIEDLEEPELGLGMEILDNQYNDNDDNQDDFNENNSNSNENDKILNTKIIECHFSIAEGWLCVIREDNHSNLSPIAEMHIEGLVIQYMFRSLDQVAYVGVHKVEIIDFMQTDGEAYKYLATSHPIKGQAGYSMISNSNHQGVENQENENLINIIYTKIKKKSPYYSNLDQQVDLSFNKVYFTFNRITVAALYEYINLAFLSDGERRTKRKLKRLEKYNALPDYIHKINENNINQKPADYISNDVKLEPPIVVVVKVTVILSSIYLLFNDNGSEFAICGIKDLAVGVLYRESIMEIKGTLADIFLEDKTSKANYYPRLITIEGKECVSFVYRQFTPAFADYPGYKQKLRLKLKSVKISLLQRFFFEFSDYFSNMSEIKSKLAETSFLSNNNNNNQDQINENDDKNNENTSSSTTNNNLLTNEQKFNQKFRFEIVLEYLKLDIPKNSISPEYIQLNMGKISLCNYHFLIEPNEFIYAERMSFLMSDACAYAGNTLEPNSLLQIIDNIDLLMEWERSIDDNDHIIPGFRLSVDCPEIKFKMTEKQYALWMNTIRQFITERSLQSQRRQILKGIDIDYEQEQKQLEQKRQQEIQQKLSSKSIHNINEIKGPVYTTVAVALNFHGGSVEIIEEITNENNPNTNNNEEITIKSSSSTNNLINNNENHHTNNNNSMHKSSSSNLLNSNLKNQSSSSSSDKIRKFQSQAIGELKEFAFVWISTSDGKSKMHFSFDDIVVYDSRPKSINRFSKLWYHEKKENKNTIFNFYYTNNGKGNGKISFQFDRPRMIMLPLVYKVIKFFTNPYLCYELPSKLLKTINDGLPKDKQLPRPIIPILQPVKNVRYEEVTVDSLFHSSILPGFSMNFSMIDVLMKLPADPKDENSSGIIFHADLLMKYNSTDPINGFRLFLDNWQVNRCLLRDEQNTMTRIIKPFNLSISMLNTPISCNAYINIDPIFVSFSYRDFKSLMAIISCLTPPEERIIDDEDVIKRQEEQQKQQAAQKSKQQQIANVISGGLKVNLIDDLNGNNIPLLNLRVYGLIVKLDNWSTALSTSIQCRCQSEYYNRINTSWEPLIEPWTLTTKFSKFPLPNTDPIQFFSRITLNSSEILNVNISKTFSDTMQNCIQSWTDDYFKNHYESSSLSKDYGDSTVETISLRNETGVTIQYWYGSNESMILPNNSQVILYSHELKIGSEHSDREFEIERVIQSNTISIQVEGGWNTIEYLPIFRIGSWIVNLKPKPENGAVKILWSVEKDKLNSRLAIIRSNVKIKNTTNTDIDVEIRIPYRSIAPVHTIKAKKSWNLPLQFARSGNLFIRPSNQDIESYNWSTNSIQISSISSSSQSLSSTSISSSSSSTTNSSSSSSSSSSDLFKKHLLQCEQGSRSWYICWSINQFELKGRKTIILSPPIQIENLLCSPVEYTIRRKGSQFPLANSILNQGKILEFFYLPFKQAEISVTLNNFQKGKFESLEAQGVIEFTIQDKKNRELVLYLDNLHIKRSTKPSILFAKHWLINKTGLPLFFMRKTLGYTNDIAPGQNEIENVKLPHDPALWYSDEEICTKRSQPLMYSYRTNDIFINKTCIKVANSKWSKPFSLESIGTDGSVSIPDIEPNKTLFQLAVTIELKHGKYSRTKEITFRPRFILINRMERNLYYRQVKTDYGLLLAPGKSIAFHWLHREKPNELCITFSPEYTWSSGFQISDISEFAIKIKDKDIPGKRDPRDRNSYLVRVEVQLQNSTFFVIIKPEAPDVPPYIIDNQTKLNLIYYQKSSSFKKDVSEIDFIKSAYLQEIKAKQKMSYTWDVPNDPHILVVQSLTSNFRREYNLDKIKQYPPVSFTIGKDLYRIVGDVIANGPTRILCIFDAQERAFSDKNSPKGDQFIITAEQDMESTITLQFTVELAGCGISVVNELPQELIYLTMNDIWVDYSNSSKQMRVEVRVLRLQIDNQLPSTTFPVLLCRTPLKGDPNVDFFHFSMIKSNFYTSIDYFHYFSFLLQEMDLHVDDTIINLLLKFTESDSENKDPLHFDKNRNHDDEDLHNDDDNNNSFASDQILYVEPTESAKKLYFVLLHINPIKCNVTFCYSYFDSVTSTSYGNESSQNRLQSILNAIGVTVANIEDAPISLRSLMLENSFNTRPEMISRILKHYYMQVLYEMYKIVGSFDIIGNPVSLVHNLGTGVHDFFYEPASGLVQSPREFVLGVGKGSSSLIKNSVVGIFGTASKITKTLGKGAAHLTFDKNYVREREKGSRSREKPKHIGEGVALGAKELKTGFKKGFTGFFTSPLDGAKGEGVKGFVKGVGKGVIGGVVKPGVGLFDLATRATQGITNFAAHDIVVVRTRPPRGFGPDKILRTFDVEKAIGQSILRSLDDGRFANEWHLYHCVSSNETIVMVSNKNLFSISIVPQLCITWSTSLSGLYFFVFLFF